MNDADTQRILHRLRRLAELGDEDDLRDIIIIEAKLARIAEMEATIRQMANSLRAIREEHEDIPALVGFIDGELSRWAERGQP